LVFDVVDGRPAKNSDKGHYYQFYSDTNNNLKVADNSLIYESQDTLMFGIHQCGQGWGLVKFELRNAQNPMMYLAMLDFNAAAASGSEAMAQFKDDQNNYLILAGYTDQNIPTLLKWSLSSMPLAISD